MSNDFVTMLAGANGIAVGHGRDEYTSVAYLARVGMLEQYFNSGLYEAIATDDGDVYTLDDVGRVLHTAVNPLLTLLAYAVYVGILKPVDVCCHQRFFDLIKLGLSDDCFNLLHNTILFNGRYLTFVFNFNPIEIVFCQKNDAKLQI